MPEAASIALWVGAQIGENGCMDMTTLFTMALGLQAPWQVTDLQFDEALRRLDIRIDFSRGAHFPCPICGQLSKTHDTEEKTWRHLDFFQHAAYLTARVPRCSCSEHGVKQVEVPWARANSGFTLLFEALIMMLVQAMPVASAAKLIGEYDNKLWRVLHHYVDEARAQVDMSQVTRIGIDETSSKRGHNYITLAVDMDEKKVLFVTEGKDAKTLKAFKEDLEAHGGKPEQIQEACLDMSQAFIKGLGEHFPKAYLTFDRFHVMQMANNAVDEVRRMEAKERPELKASRYVWLKNPSNLTAKQEATLHDLRNLNLRTAEAYRMRLTLQDFYEQPNPKAARQFLDEWIQMVRESSLEPMIQLAQSLENHRDGILRWFRSGLANGILEGINSLIQAAKAKARGYRTTRNLIAITYLIAGKLPFKLAPI
jgi:transposase